MSTIFKHLSLASNGDVGGFVATPVMDVLDAAYHTGHSYPGGLPALAARMPPSLSARGERKPTSASTLQHKLNPNNTTHHVHLTEARDMMVLSNDYRILFALAAATGHVCIPKASVGGGVTMQKVGLLAKEFGDVVAATTKAASRNSPRGEGFSRNERSAIEREAVELIQALHGLLGSLHSDAGE